MGKALGKVNPERKRARFSKQFKLEAVRCKKVVQDVGIEPRQD